jgi:hypothetical protein
VQQTPSCSREVVEPCTTVWYLIHVTELTQMEYGVAAAAYELRHSIE